MSCHFRRFSCPWYFGVWVCVPCYALLITLHHRWQMSFTALLLCRVAIVSTKVLLKISLILTLLSPIWRRRAPSAHIHCSLAISNGIISIRSAICLHFVWCVVLRSLFRTFSRCEIYLLRTRDVRCSRTATSITSTINLSFHCFSRRWHAIILENNDTIYQTRAPTTQTSYRTALPTKIHSKNDIPIIAKNNKCENQRGKHTRQSLTARTAGIQCITTTKTSNKNAVEKIGHLCPNELWLECKW